MIELARLLRPRGITVELIGPADARARAQIEPAQAAGLLRWRGFVVPFGDTRAAADAVLGLDGDISLRAKMGRRGHEAASRSLGWPSDAREFVAQLESWAKKKLPARRFPISRS